MPKDNDPVGTWQLWHKEGNTFRHAANIENTNYVGAFLKPSFPESHSMQEGVTWLGDNHRPPGFGDKFIDPTGKALELYKGEYGMTALRETEHPAARAALAETDPSATQNADRQPTAAAPTLQAENAKMRGFIERWLSAQPGQDYKQYIDPKALAEEARHLIGNAAEPSAAAGNPTPDFRADVFDALMTRLEAFGDHSARLARTQEQKALAKSFGALVAEVDATIRYTAEATAQHGHPLATANLQADNARLWNTLTRLVYDAAGDQANPLIRDKTLQTIETARAALAETDPSSTKPADRQPAAASDYARTLDATARSAQPSAPGRGIDR
jgi:hypothetical protein